MKIVGIHGIGHTYLTAPQIESKWLPALQGGLEEAGFRRVNNKDFVAVSYGTLFRPQESRSGNVPKLNANDIQDEWEKALLEEWWKEAAALSAENRSNQNSIGEDLTIQGPDFEGRGRTSIIVQRGLKQLVKSKYFKAIGSEKVLIFGLKQVKEYLHNPSLKKYIQDRVVARVSDDTKVIIGHSLGSIVAYECLCAHPEWKVDLLLTLGSPLGIPNLIFDELTPRPEGDKGQWPNVKTWVNIADRGDIVALEKMLAPKFGSVEDHLIYNGWESHSAESYLNSREAGYAIGSVLR
jgi:hypothetical protein